LTINNLTYLLTYLLIFIGTKDNGGGGDKLPNKQSDNVTSLVEVNILFCSTSQ